MRIIDDSRIRALGITPMQCVEWVREAFLLKERCQLPPKISLHPQGSDFINTMPCLLPEDYHRFGCKIVSRIKGSVPALKSEMIIVDSASGTPIAIMNCDWITAMRTGAVAALAIDNLKNSSASVYSFIGLGVIGHSTLECLLPMLKDGKCVVRLKRYKNHAEKTIEKFQQRFPRITFEIHDSMESLVRDADVVVSCITDADGMLVEDTDLFKPGVLIVPVHTRGFQNCDRIFDRVIADDEGHVSGFRYFSEFKRFAELSDVIKGSDPGRENDSQRILSYNIGLGLHDILFGTKILDLIEDLR